MFGPDKCGLTNKVHLIFKHKNPKSGEYVEHHLTTPPSVPADKLIHVYTATAKKWRTKLKGRGFNPESRETGAFPSFLEEICTAKNAEQHGYRRDSWFICGSSNTQQHNTIYMYIKYIYAVSHPIEVQSAQQELFT